MSFSKMMELLQAKNVKNFQKLLTTLLKSININIQSKKIQKIFKIKDLIFYSKPKNPKNFKLNTKGKNKEQGTNEKYSLLYLKINIDKRIKKDYNKEEEKI